MTNDPSRLTSSSVTADIRQALAGVRAFIMYRLVNTVDAQGRPKLDKVPTHPVSGWDTNPHSADVWMTPEEASMWAEQWGQGYGVGVVISEDIVLSNGRRMFALDLDGCRDGNVWAPHAHSFVSKLEGGGVEVSVSGQGLHVFGTYSGARPDHGTKNKTYRLELFSRLRFIACTGLGAVGDPLKDLTREFHALVRDYFPPHDDADDGGELTTVPVPDWIGPDDDDELLRRALNSHGLAQIFGGKVPFADLFNANEAVLARAYPPQQHGIWDGSAADLALANHLSFWTGSNGERMLRLMLRSKLVRPKWERPGYLHRTIQLARASQRQWYKDPRAISSNVPTGTPEAPPAPTETNTPDDDYTALIDRSDAGNGNLLIRHADGTLRHVTETRQWLHWTGTRWQLDDNEVFANRAALEVAKWYLLEAERVTEAGRWDLAEALKKWATKCRNKTALDAMLVQARKVSGVPISVNELDRNPWVLGVENGVVDLRTGELRPDGRDEFITKRCRVRYEPSATSPRWEAAIAEITGTPLEAERDARGEVVPGTVGGFAPRPQLARYLHKALGYAITGATREQKFFLAIGDGSNGKGVIFDTLIDLLGPYAMVMPSEMFIATKNAHDPERPTALAASVAGVRLVVSSETKDGQQLDIGVVKNHTGDKKLTARRMRQDPITFEITHKPWLLTNVQPKIEHMDAATRGRLHLVPFDRRWNRPGEPDRDAALPDGDKTLMAHLLTHEKEGILAWLVRGAVLYQQEGLTPPSEVSARTRDYIMSQDHIGRWLATLERCPVALGTLAAELFRLFCNWCMTEGCAADPSTQTAFGIALDKRRVPCKRFNDGKRYGLRNVVAAPPPPAE